jgi:chromosome segregation ATPase
MTDESDTIDVAEDKTKKPVPPAQPDEDYEKRFKGLQKLFEKQQKKVTDLEEERDKLLETRESSTQTEKQKQVELDKAKLDLDLLTREKETLTAKLTTHESKAQRTELILSDFSDLAAFEAQKMLPDAPTIEELRTKLTAFRAAYQASVEKTVQAKIQGAGPAPTAPTIPPAGRSKEQIYAELSRLAGSRNADDRKKYDELVEEWDKLDTK